jgi:hypothetical protein
MALEGPSFLPFNASTLPAATTSITIGLVLCQRWFLLHEVMSPDIMVCVTLILKTFEHVHLVDRPFSNGGQLMCHEVFIYVEDIIGSTWVSDTPASNFVSGITAPLRGLIL